MIENRPQIPSSKQLPIQTVLLLLALIVEFPVMWWRSRLIEDLEMSVFLDRNKKLLLSQNWIKLGKWLITTWISSHRAVWVISVKPHRQVTTQRKFRQEQLHLLHSLTKEMARSGLFLVIKTSRSTIYGHTIKHHNLCQDQSQTLKVKTVITSQR